LPFLVQCVDDRTLAITFFGTLEPIVDRRQQHVSLEKFGSFRDDCLQDRQRVVRPAGRDFHRRDLKPRRHVPRSELQRTREVCERSIELPVLLQHHAQI
jgi:hypothetical protein